MNDSIEIAPLAPGNVPEWSVSELSGALKRTVEDAFGFVRVRAEISGFKGPSASGHVYFALKDQNAKIDAVIWKGVYGRLKTKPQEGLEVIVTGKITTFPGKSSYQIIIDSIEPAGIGALMALLEERRRKLTAEGLFDEARKQLIPYLPQVIGVITSPTGAVIRDILHRLEDRFPRHVIVWPVRVQGETSAAEVANAINGFNALPEGGRIARPDVIIVARGGGSLEDLMGFNEESVVRAASASMIPLISAVGHETDWTLIDHAADLRAPTPTGAAEKVVPVRAELMATLDDLARRRHGAMRRWLDRQRADLRAASRALPQAESIFAAPRQRLDLATARLAPALARNARTLESRLALLGRRLLGQSPAARVARQQTHLAGLGSRLAQARASLLNREQVQLARRHAQLQALEAGLARNFRLNLARRTEKLASLWQLAASLGPEAVLARGYAMVLRPDGSLVRTPDVEAGTGLNLRFASGTLAVTVDGGGGKAARPKAPIRAPGQQGDLF